MSKKYKIKIHSKVGLNLFRKSQGICLHDDSTCKCKAIFPRFKPKDRRKMEHKIIIKMQNKEGLIFTCKCGVIIMHLIFDNLDIKHVKTLVEKWESHIGD